MLAREHEVGDTIFYFFVADTAALIIVININNMRVTVLDWHGAIHRVHNWFTHDEITQTKIMRFLLH
jgi:hypothetical protein